MASAVIEEVHRGKFALSVIIQFRTLFVHVENTYEDCVVVSGYTSDFAQVWLPDTPFALESRS